jgi:hypothetical protein
MNDTEKGFLVVIALTIATVIASFASMLNIDFLSATKVFGWLCLFVVALFATIKSGFFSVKYIPFSIVWFLACFRPAYHFWAYGSGNNSLYALKIYREIPWYANDWIQLGIALAIIIFGHLIVLKIRNEI